MAKDDRFSMSRNFLATDKVPDTIFGIPVVSNEDDYTPEDLAFFREHPEAGGYYDLGEEESPEEAPVQAAKGGETFDTPIPEELRARYDAWYAQLPENLRYTGDYDLQGTWLERLGQPDRYVPSQNGHLDDYGKKPNHITFSTGSKWHDPKVPERTGGEWRRAKDGSWDFYPGTGNQASDDELEAYFGKYEKGNRVHRRGARRGAYPGKLNNPGNVEKRAERRRGEIASPHDRWAKFATPQDGLREMAGVMRQIADVKLAEKDLPFTIRNFAETYAPRFNEKGEPENDTDKYIRDISSTSGIGADTVLDRWNTDDMARLMKTVVRFESGVPHSEWFTDDEYRTAARELEEGATD